ncbi:MAG: hypothetical protein ACLQOO_24065 [Terriglobia bacterium]
MRTFAPDGSKVEQLATFAVKVDSTRGVAALPDGRAVAAQRAGGRIWPERLGRRSSSRGSRCKARPPAGFPGGSPASVRAGGAL